MRMGHNGMLSRMEVALGVAGFLCASAAGAGPLSTAVSAGSAAIIGALLGIAIGGTWLVAVGMLRMQVELAAVPLSYLWAAIPGGVVGSLFALSVRPTLRVLESRSESQSRQRGMLLAHAIGHFLVAVLIASSWGLKWLYVTPFIALTTVGIIILVDFRVGGD